MKHYHIIIVCLLVITACDNKEVAKVENSYQYPLIIIENKLEQEFDNAAWMYYASMNIYPQECYNSKQKNGYNFSIVETNPTLINNVTYCHDTLTMGLSYSYKDDSIAVCIPKGMHGVEHNAYFLQYWFIKGSNKIIFRDRGLAVKYTTIYPDRVMYNLKDSLTHPEMNENKKRGIYPLDEQEQRLIDTIRANKNKLNTWFLKEAIKRKIL